MIAFLLSMILFGQGNPALVTDTGTIAGVLKTASGQPASGIRVTAIALPDNAADAASSISYGGLTETDEAGRYRLENIAPGRYFVAAGRVDLPTYYPGTLERTNGRAVSIASKAVATNIDFVVDEASFRLPGGEVTNFIGSITGLTMPVQVRMEGNLKQPVMSDGQPVMIKFTRMQDQSAVEMTLNDSIQNFSIPNPSPGAEYRVSVENLPRGYVLKSMVQEGIDLRNDMLKLTAKNFALTGVAVTGAMAPDAHVKRFQSNAGIPMTPLEITLAAAPASLPAAQGVRVTGRAASTGFWYLNISGTPGILFADGSFEFRGVNPGRHLILLQDRAVNPSRLLAASVVVGNMDLDGVVADETRVLPVEVRFPTGMPSPGSIPLAWIRGKVVDEASKEPVFGGTVTITGKIRTAFPIDSLGEFQIPRLLPGTYELSIEGFQHNVIRQNVVVGDEDVSVSVSARAPN